MKKICKNCKYWEEKAQNWQEKDFRYCNCDKFLYNNMLEPEEITNDMLLYGDYEGYSASFETGKNFGCIHWKGELNE